MEKKSLSHMGLFSRSTWRIIFSILMLFLVICAISPSYSIQNDTFYVIKIGEHFLDHGIDLVDHWAWSAQIEITYPHFLLNIILAVLYRTLGLDSIYVFVLLIGYLLALSMYYISEKVYDMTVGKEDNSLYPLVGFLVSMIIMGIFPSFIVARSQLLTFPLWLWEMWFIIRLLNTGLKRYGAGIIVFSWLCALTHATAWYFTFILFIPFFATVYFTKLKKYLSSKNINLDSVLYFEKIIFSTENECHNVKKLWVVLLLSYATGLLTPTRICYTSVFKIGGGNPVKYIAEFEPLSTSNAAVIFICVFLLVFLLLFFRVKCRLDFLFLFIGTFAMALISFRHVGLLSSVSCYALFYVIFDALRQIPTKIRENRINSIVLFLLIPVFALCGLKYNNFSYFTLLNPSWVSVDAMDYIEENYDTETLKLFNDYNFGAYMLFRDIPVFIDSRVNEYTKQFNPGLTRDVFDDYVAVAKLQNNWRDVVTYYDFDGYFIQKTGPLFQYLSSCPDVELVWEDDNTAIFMTKKKS